MPLTKLEIANMALVEMGQSPILDFESEDDPTAVIIRTFYNAAVEFCLRINDWSFSRKRQQIAKDPDAPVYKWKYQFPKPSKCIRIMEVADKDGEPISFAIEGPMILADSYPIKVKYTVNDVEYAPYSPEFNFLLAAFLAYLTVYPITQSRSKKSEMFDAYKLLEEQYTSLDQTGTDEEEISEEYASTSSWSE